MFLSCHQASKLFQKRERASESRKNYENVKVKICKVCGISKDENDFFKSKPKICKDCIRTPPPALDPLPQTKICSWCHIEKSRSDFHHREMAPDRLATQCKLCYSLRTNDNERRTNIGFRSRFGIGSEEYMKLMAEQDYKCALCLLPLSELSRLPHLGPRPFLFSSPQSRESGLCEVHSRNFMFSM